MGRKIIIILSFCILLFGSFSNIFGEECRDSFGDLASYTNHRCEKIGSNYCYFPKSSSPTFAPFYRNFVVNPDPKISIGLEEKFSSKYGGCGIPEYNYEDKKLKIRAKDVRVDEIRNFLNSCGSYNFDIQTDLTYKL